MLSEDRKDLLFTILCCIFIAGLYFSKALLSITPYVLLALGLFRSNLKNRLKTLVRVKPFLFLTGLFLLYFFSGLNSLDKASWLRRLDNNFIYLTLPLAFALNAPIKKVYLKSILYFFFWFTFLVSAATLLSYYLNFDETNQNYLLGKTIVTPIFHTRFSMFITGSILCGFYLWREKFRWKVPYENTLLLSALVFQIVFLHILAVRTGILSFYLITIFALFFYLFRLGKFRTGVVALLIALSLPVISYYAFPSIKNKFAYVRYDWVSIFKGASPEHMSDNTRIRSIMIGLDLIKKSPIVGTGIGDMRKEVDALYAKRHPQMQQSERFLPTNQIIFTLTGFGIVGLLWFLVCLLYPLYYKGNYRDFFLASFYIIVFSAFIGENAVELILGKSFFMMLALTGVSLLNTSDREQLPWLKD